MKKPPDISITEDATSGKDPPREDEVPVAERPIRLAQSECSEFFTDDRGNPFVQIPLDGHREIWALKGARFQRWLAAQYRATYGQPPNMQALKQAILILWTECDGGKQYKLYNRVAWHEGALYYDLANHAWRAVRITASGWQMVDDPPILFRRYDHQKPQVEPAQGGDARALLKYLNLPLDPSLELLLLVYVGGCFVADFPHPIVVLTGPQGSAKSSLFRFVRAVVDPSRVPILSFPRKAIELVQQLSHHWLSLYDNVTDLPDWLSDALCRASTGEGMSKRVLYTIDEDFIYEFRRCVGINAITNPATRADLLDRCIIFNLPSIPPQRRQPESELWEQFEKELPGIVGGFFDTLSHAIKTHPIKLPWLPRLADFARWGAGIAEGLGYSRQEFIEAYRTHIGELHQRAIEAQPLAQAIIALMQGRNGWEGTATELLQDVRDVALFQLIDTDSETWPTNPEWLSRRLGEAEHILQQVGIQVERHKEQSRRLIVLTRVQAKNDESTAGNGNPCPAEGLG